MKAVKEPAVNEMQNSLQEGSFVPKLDGSKLGAFFHFLLIVKDVHNERLRDRTTNMPWIKYSRWVFSTAGLGPT